MRLSIVIPAYNEEQAIGSTIEQCLAARETIIDDGGVDAVEIIVVSDGTTDVRWEDGAGGTAFGGQIPLQVREGYVWSAGGLVPLFVCADNTLLNMELTAAINVHGSVSFTTVNS